MTRAPSASRRGTARISAMVMSAVSSVSTPGVLVTVMPRASAACDVDVVDAVAEIGDQLEVRPAWASTSASIWSVTVGTSTSAVLTASSELGRRHRLVVDVEAGVEQLAHARLDHVGQLARDDDERLLAVGIAAFPRSRSDQPSFTVHVTARSAQRRRQQPR